MNKLIVIYFFVFSLSAWAVDPKNLPDSSNQLKQWESGEELDSSYQPKKETIRLSWKLGLSAHKDWLEKESNFFSAQVPVLAELYFPITSSFEWLLQAGAGFRLEMEKREACDPSFIPDPPRGTLADNEILQKWYKRDLERATNKDTCYKKKKKEYEYIPYFIGQTGFKYGSDIYVMLQGGTIISLAGDMDWTAELL